METDKDLEYIKQWTTEQKEDILPLRNVRHQLKAKMEEIARKKNRIGTGKAIVYSA